MPILVIDDAADPRLADYRSVSDPELAARGGFFVAEGRLVVGRLFETGRLAVRSVMVTGPALASIEHLLAVCPGIPAYQVPQRVMNGVTGFNIHRGCLAIGERPAPQDWRELATGTRAAPARLVVLEQVANADNVGSVFRSAAALGATAVFLGPDCADPLYRKAIRTSMGASLHVPFAHVAPLPTALLDLRGAGFRVIALTPDPSAPELREVIADAGLRPTALVLGHEGDGLTSDAIGACERRARIAIAPHVDSLNVATAAAIALYELGLPRPSDPDNSGAPRALPDGRLGAQGDTAYSRANPYSVRGPEVRSRD